jgi:SpoVK/Ycf46/Vps4 family AAA+-type ATPase
MSLPGLQEPKAMFLNARAKIQAAIRRATGQPRIPDLKKINLNILLTGNEGTGKSLLAKLYAKFLISMGVLRTTEEHDGIVIAKGHSFVESMTVAEIENCAKACGGCVSYIYFPKASGG